ncbi:MAG TPA: hypothetical protein VM865_01595 [Acidobacteriaceae bacterium]|jgi:hypothetical protein|nr:hypothetical protein [Acidobacteriaceae bacterium]
MKNTFVRAFVLSLTFAGLTAQTLTAKVSSPATAPSKVLPIASSWTGYPIPLCAPSDPTYCGMR